MSNSTHIDRYKSLLSFLDKRFKKDISIKDIEEVSFYSYRNINRIFFALHHETIGKHIKRIKLEKAAQYLKYSDILISDIAFNMGYSDVSAFSKAFKNQFNCSPSQFRETQELKLQIQKRVVDTEYIYKKSSITFEIEELPSLDVLCLTYHGAYENIDGIKKTWEQLVDYALKNNLINQDTICLAEILDDNDITDTIHCRYNAAIIVKLPLKFEVEGLFRTKTIAPQKYIKFLHKGSYEDSLLTYDYIYAYWMTDIQFELVDKPTIEFFLNDETDTPTDQLLTEIYIPVK